MTGCAVVGLLVMVVSEQGTELIEVWRGAPAAVRAKKGLKTRATTADSISTVVAQDFSPAHWLSILRIAWVWLNGTTPRQIGRTIAL